MGSFHGSEDATLRLMNARAEHSSGNGETGREEPEKNKEKKATRLDDPKLDREPCELGVPLPRRSPPHPLDMPNHRGRVRAAGGLVLFVGVKSGTIIGSQAPISTHFSTWQA